jgi:phenylacetate-CoA ligase
VDDVTFLNPTIEKMDTTKLQTLQEKGLRRLITYLTDHSKFYRSRFKEANIDFHSIKTLNDLEKIPFTWKKDFRDNYPTRLFCTPLDQVIRYHASSGTTGKPTIVGYTRNDIREWSISLARGLKSLGIDKRDVIQNSYGYGLFTGGLGFHYAAELTGATILPMGAGGTERQITLMQDLGSTIITCTPSYFLHLAEIAESLGISFKEDTMLKAGVFGAEPWSEDMRRRIEDSTSVKAYDVYGTSELSGPLFTECTYQNGLHIWADQYIVEIINPDTGEVLDEGERGELVVTTLTKEALPLLRYRTGDITYIVTEQCECGRTHPRMMRIHGRTDDMLVIRGINVFPSQVESVLMKIPELSENYQLIINREHELDKVTVKVELAKIFKEREFTSTKIENKIINDLRNVMNLSVEVELVKPGILPRSMGKAKRVIDKRKF